MNTLTRAFRVIATLTVLVFAAILTPLTASAIDKVVLKDGTVVEGTIVREVDGFVWIKTSVSGIEQEKLFTPQEIGSIARDTAAAPVTSDPVVADSNIPKVASTGPRAAVITLGSREEGQGHMVGVHLQAHELREMIPMLEEEIGSDGTGVVVLRVCSGGGYTLEVQRLSDVIHNEYKKRFRVVAWIDSAISAAAMTSHCIEEIYFTPQGNYGACTEFSGNFNASKGRDLEERLYQMEQISTRGGYNSLIMRAMQIQSPLSATIDANGEVKWYNSSTDGEIRVNRDNEILTFNAETAKQVKFSKGTANSVEELQTLMGYRELQWVGKKEKGFSWPISKAEAWNINWRKKVNDDQENLDLYFAKYNREIAAAQAEPLATRGKFVNAARGTLNKLREAVRRNPNMALFTFGLTSESEIRDFFDRQEKILRDLMR